MATIKNERIDIRVSTRSKETFRRAAEIMDKNISEFLLEAGLAAASRTLADRTKFGLSDVRWSEFQDALDRPVRHKPRLAELLSKPSVLE